jgi:hypothetical protein
MAGEVLMTISRDEAERARLMSEFKYQVDMRSHINHAKQEGAMELYELIKDGKSPEEAMQILGMTDAH